MVASGVLTSTLDAIGGTPMVRLRALVPTGAGQVLVKLEGGNPTGSYKDRMALAMIEGAERSGALRRGRRVVEFTGGSTGSSLAFVCAVKGYPLSIVSSDAFSPEKLSTMRAFGADVTVVPSDGGRIPPDLFVRMRREVDRIIQQDGAFWTDQFHNIDALAGYATLGREILEQTSSSSMTVDVFCAAVGTAGMLVGVRERLHWEGSPATRLYLRDVGRQLASLTHHWRTSARYPRPSDGREAGYPSEVAVDLDPAFPELGAPPPIAAISWWWNVV